jgi:transposase
MKRSHRMTYMFDTAAIKKAVTGDGHTMKDFLARAGIDESTWYRWTRAGNATRPNMATVEKVNAALDKLGIKCEPLKNRRGRK